LDDTTVAICPELWSGVAGFSANFGSLTEVMDSPYN